MKITLDELKQKISETNGILKYEKDIELESIPWKDVGEKIISFYVGGNLYVRGNLYVGGYLDVGGDLYVRGNLYVGGYLNVRGNLNVRGDLYWSHASMPKAKEIKCKRVLPPAWQREYWGDRLGIDTSSPKCYDQIIDEIKPHLDEWLKLDKWTPTERWMLESLK